MTKYVVLNDAGILPFGSEVVAEKGLTVELDETNEQTIRFLEGGFIAPLSEEPLTDEQKAEIEKQNPGSFPEFAVKEETVEEKKDVVEDPAPEAAAEISADPTEPRLRYRGQLVLAEVERTVGEQTFRHITLGDGSQMDLTEQQYATEVHMSYPPIA